MTIYTASTMNVQGVYVAVFLLWLAGTVWSEDFSDMLTFENCSFAEKGPDEEEYNHVLMRFFTGNDASDPEQRVDFPFREGWKILDNENFNKSKCFDMYVPGWNTKNNDTDVVKLINALLRLNYWNTVQLVWDSVTVDTPYLDSVSLMITLAPLVAEVMDQIRDRGVDCIHFMGHSLGAQLVGSIGREMKKLPVRITGLDPVGPAFTSPLNCTQALNEGDAECVTVLHTDAGGYGILSPSGTIDHWANGGVRIQPNCTEFNATELDVTACSHIRAVEIATEAISNAYNVLSVLCSSEESFDAGECLNNTVITLLEGCTDTTIPGSYFFRTDELHPLGIGRAGTKPAPNEEASEEERAEYNLPVLQQIMIELTDFVAKLRNIFSFL